MQDNNNSCCHEKPLWLQILMGIGIAALSLYLIFLVRNTYKQYDYIGKSAEFPHTISINGTGKVLAIPDIAEVSLGLKNTKTVVAEAQKQNTETMNKIYADLANLKIDKKDISTTEYNVYPEYDWRNNSQIFKGYTVSQTVRVKIRDFENISKALELVGKYNLNQAGGLNFTVDEPEKYQQEARIKALKNAKEKAEALAKEAGVKLGKVISFSENVNEPYPYMKSIAYGMGGAAESSLPAPRVEPGSQEIQVQVNISYEIL